MSRRSFAVFLAILLAFPSGALPAEKAAEPPSGGGIGGPFFWGALTLLNGTILVSSIGDLRFYEERADAADAAGEDAGAYWDAGSREKVVIGLSALSLVFSLAGLRQSLVERARAEEVPPLAAKPQVFPTPPGPVQVLSLEGRVRYDTLFTQHPAPPSETPADPAAAPAEALPEAASGGAAVPADTSADEVASILQDLEEAPPASEPPVEAGTPAPSPAPPAPDTAAPKAQVPQGPAPDARISEPEPSAPPAAAKKEKEPTFTLLPFGVHVTSFRTMAEAERDEARWRKLGERVSIEEDEVPEKGTWFRVLVGNFATLGEARAYADSVKQRHGVGYALARRRAGM
jgi:hypothetical protein